MKFNTTTTAKATLMGLMIVLISLAGIGCSSDKSTGPSGSPKTPTDEITVSLDRISVRYDCDGAGGAGDFNYSFLVQVKDGGVWSTVKSFGERQVKIKSGDEKDITDRSATFTLPRASNQKFRVFITMREDDGNDNDFDLSRTVEHKYVEGQSKLWSPDAGYTSYSSSAKTGSVDWTLDLRERQTVLGVVTREGCHLTTRYSVTIKSND